MGALIENDRHKIEAVAEQLGGVDRKLDSHTEMIGGLMTDVTSLKQDSKSLKQDVTSVKGKLDIIQSDVEIIKNDLKRKVDIQDFEALTRRVSTLEKRVLG